MKQWMIAGVVAAVLGIAVAAFAQSGSAAAPSHTTSTSLTAAGAGSAGQLPKGGSEAVADYTKADLVPGTIHFTDVGVRVEPVADTGSARITPDAAVQDLERAVPTPPSPYLASAPIVILGSYSNDVRGEIQADGSVKPSDQGRLAWVVTYSLSKPLPMHGGLGGSSHPSTDNGVPSGSCTFVGSVDAVSGEFIEAFSTCRQPLVPIPAS